MLRVIACIALDHNPLLVALAAVICALACLTYINMLSRAAAGTWITSKGAQMP